MREKTRSVVTLSDAAATLAAYSAAVRLGVLDRIDREPATPAELAVTCGLSERGSALLLAALESTGFVEQLSDGRYRPAIDGLAALHSMLPVWERLSDVVRTGRPALPVDAPSPAEHAWPLGPFGAANPDTAARAAASLPSATRVLEVAAGTVPWSLALAERNPACRVTMLDLPAAVPLARRAVSSAGLADRFDFLAGDVFDLALDRRAYDLIVVGQFCHLFDESTCDTLIRRLAPALAPGGVLAVIDVLPSRPHTALFELSLCLHTQCGGLHHLADYQRWLGGAGLVVADVVHLDGDVPSTMITGRTEADAA